MPYVCHKSDPNMWEYLVNEQNQVNILWQRNNLGCANNRLNKVMHIYYVAALILILLQDLLQIMRISFQVVFISIIIKLYFKTTSHFATFKIFIHPKCYIISK